MSLFGSMIRDFGDDPFFSSFQSDQMPRPDRMAISNFTLPFGGMLGGFNFLPFQDDVPFAHPRRGISGVGGRLPGIMPFGFGRGGFPDIGGMFSGMERMNADPNCTMYSSSSMVSYSMGSDGQPKVYQASSSTTTAPGGVKETRRAMSDSTTGVRKLAIGHHLGERAHIVEKSRNRVTGEEDDAEEFINIGDGEEERFNEEWSQRTSHARRKPQSRPAVLHRPNADRHLPALAIAAASEETQRRCRKRDRDGNYRDADGQDAATLAVDNIRKANNGPKSKSSPPKRSKTNDN